MRDIFDDEHHEFRRSLRSLLAAELAPRLEECRTERRIPRHVWQALGAAGFLGFMVPEEHGGGGVDDFRFNAVLGEELAAYGVAYASCIGINTDVLAPYLLELTTDEQRARWLPAFAGGELVTAIAMTEPGAGSDLGALRTSAVRAEGGWRLNGTKTFITNGAGADLVVVAARTPEDGPRSITLFAVERGMAGFGSGTKLDKLGQHEADTAELFFTDVLVPDANVLGAVGAGFGHMMERLPRERLSVAVVCVAHAAAALERTLGYVKERQAFGQAIGSFQHNKFVLAELHTAIEVTRRYVYDVVESCVLGTMRPEEAAMAKYAASELQGRVLDACVQLHGGYGYMQEYEVARGWADARVTRIWAGSNEIMREIIGRSLGL